MSKIAILEASRTLFARKGYAECSLREIAEAVGIKTPSLYAHFSSKEALYQAVYAEVTVEHTKFFDDLAASDRDAPPRERLRRLLDGIESYYRDRPDLAVFSLRAAIAEYTSEGGELRRIFLDSESSLGTAVRQTFLDGVRLGDFADGDADGFCALVLVVMDGLFLQLTHYEPTLYRERLESAWVFLSASLAPRVS